MSKKIIIILMMALLAGSVCAVKNPSAVYCEEMGYEFIINTTEGGAIGLCILPDGSSVGAWDFLKGKVAEEYSYCEKQGYALKTIEDGEKCSSIYSYDCAVCVKDDKETEVTKLMNLNYNEGICGDGYCFELEEDYETCPEDCPIQQDGYCDITPDDLCDPDCNPGEDPDCGESGKTNYLATASLIFFVLLLAFLAAITFIKLFKRIRKRKSKGMGMIKKLEKKEKDINLKKSELKKGIQKELKEKEKILKKKESFLDRLLGIKKKVRGKEKQVLEKKLEHDKKTLTKEKSDIKKELGKKLETKEKLLKSKEIKLKKEKKQVKNKIHQDIRKLLSVGREQLASGNKSGARDTYRKIRKLYGSLKNSEKNKELYDRILAFHKKLTK